MFVSAVQAQYLLKQGDLPTIYYDLNGNLGVGTTSPTSRFHIRSTTGFPEQPLLRLDVGTLGISLGSVQSCFTENGQNYGIYQTSSSGMVNYFKDNVVISKSFIGDDGEGNQQISLDRYVPFFKFAFNTTSGPTTFPLVINAQGIQVSSKLVTDEFQLLTNPGTNKVLLSDANGNGTWTDLSNFVPDYWKPCGQHSIYTDYDRVGIGTNNPSEKLEISHNDPTGGIVINQTSEDYHKSEIKFNIHGQEEWAIGNNIDDNNRHYFFVWSHVNQTTAFFIDGSNGMTGIGTSWPRAKLEVNGNFKATAIGIGIDPLLHFQARINYGLKEE